MSNRADSGGVRHYIKRHQQTDNQHGHSYMAKGGNDLHAMILEPAQAFEVALAQAAVGRFCFVRDVLDNKLVIRQSSVPALFPGVR